MAIFTNQATLSYNNTVTNSNITTGQLLEVLSVTKTAVVDRYSFGDTITYVISIINSGAVGFNELTLTDSLGAYSMDTATLYPLDYVENSVRYYVNGVLQTAPSVTVGPPLLITGISVPASGNTTLIYQAEVTHFAPLISGSTIENDVLVQGIRVPSPLTATETITVIDAPELTISKSLNPTVVSENGRLTYTFVIQNYGNTAATVSDNAVVTDIFDPILNNLQVTFNGTPWTETDNYIYNQSTGEFATIAGQITIPPATYMQDPATGAWITNPGVGVLTVEGTI